MSTFFQPGMITRTGRGVPAQAVEWAAIDLETTGLNPARDRTVEVAVVRFRSDGTITDEYCTLINPQRRMGCGEIHQLTGRDVADAPTFAEIYPDLLRMLSGAVAVAHNISFEDGFLGAEVARLGHTGLAFPGVCSLDTARAQLQGKSFKLISLHKTFTGEWIEDQHTALGDARALAVTWAALLKQAPQSLFYVGPPPSGIPPMARSMRRIAPRPVEMSSPRLGEFARRFPRCSVDYQVDSAAEQAYLSELRLVVEDEIITLEESARLEQLARRAGLTQQALEVAHRQVWEELTAASDSAQSRADQQRRDRLATNLGLRGSTRLNREQAAELDAAALRPHPGSYLRGWRIGIDPTSETEPVADLAGRHGASIAKRLTATVRWVAASDPDGDSTTLKKARDLGLKVVSVAEAKKLLEQQVAAAREDEAERITAAQQWQQARSEREQLFRHTWLPHEQLHNMEFAGRPRGGRLAVVQQPLQQGAQHLAGTYGQSTNMSAPPAPPGALTSRQRRPDAVHAPVPAQQATISIQTWRPRRAKKSWWRRLFGR